MYQLIYSADKNKVGEARSEPNISPTLPPPEGRLSLDMNPLQLMLKMVGPDLAGAAQRFSPADLFNAIVFPSRDVAPAYRMTTFNLRNGDTYNGLVAFESADGVMIHTGMGTTLRLNDADIASRQPGAVSFMPAGLLGGAGSQDLADLYAYLKTLQAVR